MPGKVLIVDDSSDLRESLGELVDVFMSAASLKVAGLEEIRRHEQEALSCDYAILDINLGAHQPSGLDVYRWLKNHNYQGRMLFLTGHATDHPLVTEARRLGGVPVCEKPFDIGRLIAILEGRA